MKNLLVLAASKGYGFSIGTLMMNIAQVSPHTFSHAMVYSNDISSRDKEIISDVLPADFIKYSPPLSKKAISRAPYIRFFTPFSLARLEAFQLVADFDTVTWLDDDIVIKRPLNDLVEKNFSGARFMMSGSVLSENLLSPISGFAPGILVPAGGTFSLSKKIAPRAEEIYSLLVDYLERYGRHMYLPDQAVMAMAFERLGVEIEKIDADLYAPHPRDAPSEAYIVHAYGPKKFWSGLHSEDWNSYYQEWVAKGGSPISSFGRWREVRRLPIKLEIRARRLLQNL